VAQRKKYYFYNYLYYSVLEHFQVKESLMKLIQNVNLELKNRALVCLQKIMMRSIKKN